MLMAIDPGKDKIGIAIYDPEEDLIIYRDIIPAEEFEKRLLLYKKEYNVQSAIIGDGTFSNKIVKQVKTKVPSMEVKIIDESYSTLEARRLYFKIKPPKGWRRLLPISMQTPKEPVDDLVAVVLLERSLGKMPKI